jgi:hypothetical protein
VGWIYSQHDRREANAPHEHSRSSSSRSKTRKPVENIARKAAPNVTSAPSCGAEDYIPVDTFRVGDDLRSKKRNAHQNAVQTVVMAFDTPYATGWFPLNFSHIPPMHNRDPPVVPRDGHRIPARFANNAAIGSVATPINARAFS